MQKKIRYDIRPSTICQQDRRHVLEINAGHFFLLTLCVLIFGSSKAYSARIRDQSQYAIPDVNQEGRVIPDKQQIPVATWTENVNPSDGERSQYRTLQRQVGSPSQFQNLLDPSMVRLHNKPAFSVGPADSSQAPRRRILSSEEDAEVEEAQLQERGGEHEHVPEHVPEHAREGEGTIDTVDDPGEEDETEEDDDDEGKEENEEEEYEEESERYQEGHSEHVGQVQRHNVDDKENASVLSKSTSFDSVGQTTHMVRPSFQSNEEIASKSRTVLGETVGIKSHGDNKGEDALYKESEQKARPENSQKDSKQARKKEDKFRGIPGGSIDGINVTHISYMLYKIVKKYDIKTLLDIPCRNNLNWFPELLHLLDFEVIGFRYTCVDEEAEEDEKLHGRFSEAGSPEFLSIPPTKSYELPRSDLIFSYDGPQQWGVRKTWAFFTGLRKVRPRYILVTNNPGQMNNDVEHTLNLRKQPFHVRDSKAD